MTNTTSFMYEYALECGHKVYTPVQLVLQYPDDFHYILCPECELREVYKTAWNPVVGAKEIDENEATTMRNVYGRLSFIVPRDILRIQPSVPIHRVRPFPYVVNRRRRIVS